MRPFNHRPRLRSIIELKFSTKNYREYGSQTPKRHLSHSTHCYLAMFFPLFIQHVGRKHETSTHNSPQIVPCTLSFRLSVFRCFEELVQHNLTVDRDENEGRNGKNYGDNQVRKFYVISNHFTVNNHPLSNTKRH